MGSQSRDDIRNLLKSFGIEADEKIVTHLARNPTGGPLRVRLSLEDLTEYGDQPPAEPLKLELEGTISR